VGTLLVVDDNQELCKTLSRVLTMNGHQCLCAHSGDGALELLKEQIPDLVIADLMMPHSSGLDLLRAVRMQPRLIDMPFVIFSAVSEEKYIKEAMALGADDYWLKGSVRGEELAKRVNAMLPHPVEKRS
jgi:chemosensory pili system protein ChpA (sensor histidine kinase/response regulator)